MPSLLVATSMHAGGTIVKTKKHFIVISRFLILAILCLLLYYGTRSSDMRSIAVVLFYGFSNVVACFLPGRVFESSRVSGLFFFFDLCTVSILLWFVNNGGTELYLIYYLTIFIAAVAKSASAAFFTCAVSASMYAMLTLYGKTHIQIDSFPFAIRTIFFFVTALFVGYLSEEARHEREAKEATMGLLKTTKRLASLFEVSKRMVSVMEFGYLHKHILDVAMEALGADTGSILLLDPEKRELRMSAAVGIPDDVREKFVARLGEGISGWVAEHGQPLLLPGHLEHETRFKPLVPKRGITSAICAPLRVSDQTLGVINLNKTKAGAGFRQDDLDLLATLANFAAIVLEKSRLHASLDVAHADLRVAADELAALFETANDAIIVFSPDDGKIRKVNYESARLTGLGRRELLEKDFRSLFHGDDSARLQQLIAQAQRTGGARADELTLIREDGTQVPVRFSANLTGYGKREVLQVVLGDISDRKKIEQHLARTERLRALGELASGVAHDFGNIIGAVLGYCQRLQRSVQTDADKRAVNIIEKSARDGAEIVRRIQDVTRTRSAQSYVPVSLAEVVRDAIAFTRSRWKDRIAKGARIDLEEKIGFEGFVSGNGAELREVLTNLLLNATDAMPKGGALTIETSCAGDMALVRVKDTGVGMTAEVKDKIFDPFFSTKGPDGTGLGLSIAYSIITAHKGRIEVESEPGKGSVFTVFLPITTELPLRHSEPQERIYSKPVLPPLKYLVIDDDEQICDMVSDMLSHWGNRVLTATDPEKGLSLYRHEKPDVVITDLKMAGQSGLDVSRKIKAESANTRVIIITGARTELTADEVRDGQVDYVLPKPFDETELAAAIASVCKPQA